MSRNEIKIRRQRASATGADRFRNYSAILSRHRRDMRKKRLVRFLWISIVAIVMILIIILIGMYLTIGSSKPKTADAIRSSAYEQGLSSKL